MYCDLNIIHPQSTLQSPNDLLELITSAICDGYSILAINHIKTGLVANETISKNVELFSNKDNIKKYYEQNCVKFLNGENNHIMNWDNIKILNRLTIEISEQKELYQLSCPNNYMKSFDIIAVKPMNDKIFESCLSSEINCDIIVLNFDVKYSFMSKKHLITSSLEKGVFYEVEYGKFVTNNESRGVFISNFLLFNDIIKGKNLIISSGAENYFMHRSPFDITTVFETIFELKHDIIKPMICENCQKVILKCIQRKYYKTTVNININNTYKQ